MDLHDFGNWGFDRYGWSPNTASQYRRAVHRAATYFNAHGVDVDRCTPDELRRWVGGLKPTAATRNQHRKALRAYCAYLIAIGVRDDDPSEDLVRLPEREPVARSLTHSDAAAFLHTAQRRGPQDRALAGVLLLAALRASESAGLAWNAVDDGWLRFTGKGNRQRNVPLHTEAARALSAWKVQCPSTQWVFPRDGEPWYHIAYNTVLDRVKAIADAADLGPITPHVLRHSGATALLDAGADLMDVKELLGHVNVATTQRYLKVRPRRLKEAVARLDFSAAA